MSGIIKELLVRSAAEIGLTISPVQLEKFEFFASELKKWNRKVNLTSITDDSGIALKHFADSMLLIELLGGCTNLLDVGSGGGFPAIPVKIILPKLKVVSVDAVEKKILFQRHVARVLGLEKFYAVHARCEELGIQYADQFDIIVSRAFSDIVSFARLAAPLLVNEGRLIAMKGKGWVEEVSKLEPGLHQFGIKVAEVLNFNLPVSGEPRSLIVMEKYFS